MAIRMFSGLVTARDGFEKEVSASELGV